MLYNNEQKNVVNNDSVFIMTEKGITADIYIDLNGKDYDGLKLVAESFVEDINMVTEIRPEILSDISKGSKNVIIAGSIGNNHIIDELILKNVIDVSSIKDKRECYKIQVVEYICEGIDQAIIIAGSDKRGTIYGIYHISELIGVSPWVYFGDVVPKKESKLIFNYTDLNFTSKEPSVKYRGFFLNDEWPSLGSWVTNTFGDFNEEFYDKVFQLILRLKGNFMWPAMWSAVFSEDGKDNPLANAELANKYGIVMGTSHHESMFRAGEEWKKINKKYGGNGLWNFAKNREPITNFWEDGLNRNSNFESLITIGMRGEQDSALEGSEEENIELLKDIIITQKKLLKKHGLETLPQVLTIYKEVEKYWYGTDKAEGLRNWDVLDDVTIMLADDNFGNLRTLPEEREGDRKAGWGMYYHFDYHGDPRSYEWVNTTPIEKVWEQMSMAYDYKVRDIWIVNVGDLKPMEFPISYFMDLAYDFETWGTDGINKTREYTEKWCTQQFGRTTERIYINEIEKILTDYIRMNGIRKPEVTYSSTYSCINYNEAIKVLNKAIDLENRAKKYYDIVPGFLKDAYYQLIYYPAAASANIVKMQIYSGLNNLYYERKSCLANSYAQLVEECKIKDIEMQDYYNNIMSNGKWKGMMSSPHIGYTKWCPDGWKYPDVYNIELQNKSIMIVDVEGCKEAYVSGTASLPSFVNLNKETYAITISNGGSARFDYNIEVSEEWINIDSIHGSISSEKTINVSIDWSKVKKTSYGLINIFGAGKSVKINITAEVIDIYDLPEMTFVETHNVISIEAEHAANNFSNSKASWNVIENYGRTLSSLKMFPTTISFEDVKDAPYLEYLLTVHEDSEYILTAYISPTNNLKEKSRLKYAVAFDEEKETVADALPDEFITGNCINNFWADSVLNNIHINTTNHKLTKGIHKLHFYGMDAGLVLQKLVLSKEKLPYSYLGPEESFYVGKK